MGLGRKIEDAFLELLETTYTLSYLPPEDKVVHLSQANTKLDLIKFFTQMAWENKLIATDKYSILLSKLEEIGRQLGSWRKGLQSKLPR